MVLYYTVELRGGGRGFPLKFGFKVWEFESLLQHPRGKRRHCSQKCCVTLHIFWLLCCTAWILPPYKQNQVSSDTHFLVPRVEAVPYRADIRGSVGFQSYFASALLVYPLQSLFFYEFDELSNFQVPYWRKIGLVSFFFSCNQSQSKTVKSCFSTK